jgi:hypothetical protein
VVPLPADDINGASLGFLTQSLALGGTIASLGLGRLIPRPGGPGGAGLGHVATLVVYALGSAAAVLWSMTWFGVGADADHLGDARHLRAAVAGRHRLDRRRGRGVRPGRRSCSAPSTSPWARSSPARASCPSSCRRSAATSARTCRPAPGCRRSRDDLYFPSAPIAGHLLVLALYAGLGCLLVLVTNMLPNRGDRTSEVDLDLRDASRATSSARRVAIPSAIS